MHIIEKESEKVERRQNKGSETMDSRIRKTLLLWILALSSVALLVVLGNISNENDTPSSTRAFHLHVRSNSKGLKEIQEVGASNGFEVSSADASKSPMDLSIENLAAKKPTQEETSLFADFVREHEKIYANSKEYNRRQRIYHESLSMIHNYNTADNANKSYSLWKMGINRFADLSQEELPLGLDKWALRNHQQTKRATSNRVKGNSLAPLPNLVDWRKKGVTTPVKNQGHCGSCWAFASTAALESHIAIHTDTLLELSVQELVTCAPNPNHCGGTGGCDGNTAELAYDFVSSGRGIVTEWDWGYISGNNHTVPACELSPKDNATIPGAIASIDGYVSIEHNDYYGLLEAVATVGPVVVNVDASNWRLYEGGIFDESQFSNSSSRDINHVVVVEGYGTETVMDPDTGEQYSQDYWLVRNSWGPLWGEDGYIRLKRDSNAATNDCKPDTSPADGIACVGPGNNIIPPVVEVCGTSGVLYDALYPVGGHLLKESQLLRAD